jgi:hypothetical protein
MAWLIILLIAFAGLHFGLLLPAQMAIVCALVATVALWLLWKLKWIILGVIGLEEIFGGRDEI